MRTDKGEAFLLRRQGKSYREISTELGVAKSTLTNWFKGVDFSQAIKEELTKEAAKNSTLRLKELNRVRGIALDAHYVQAEKEALRDIKSFRNVPLFVAAVAAYWGEGDKVTNGLIRLSNTDPKMIVVFKNFLTEICGVPETKIKGAMYLYPDLDEVKCKRYWSKQTGIKQFHKTQILPSRHKTKRLPYGTFTILTNSTYLKVKLQVWIDHLPEMVLNTVPKKKGKKIKK